jgi:hypothetical protein
MEFTGKDWTNNVSALVKLHDATNRATKFRARGELTVRLARLFH